MLEHFFKMPVSQKAAVLLVLLALIGVLYWQFYYKGLQETLETQKGQQNQLSTKLREIEKSKKRYDMDMQRRDDMKVASTKQREILPTKTEMASLLNNLNTTAELTGLEIDSVKPLEESPGQYYSRIPVALQLRGSYLQLAKFFYQIGKLERIINIENIQLTSAKMNVGEGVKMTANVLATTFRALEEEGK